MSSKKKPQFEYEITEPSSAELKGTLSDGAEFSIIFTPKGKLSMHLGFMEAEEDTIEFDELPSTMSVEDFQEFVDALNEFRSSL